MPGFSLFGQTIPHPMVPLPGGAKAPAAGAEAIKRTPNVFDRDFWIRFWRGLTENALHSLLQILVLMAAYFILRAVLFHSIDSVLTRLVAHEMRRGITEDRAGRLQTLRSICKSVLGYILFFVFGVLGLKALGLDIMPFITTASVMGIAIGFGAQKLVKDSISGFFMIIDNQFVVGDIVTISAVTGRVQEMGMRITTLVDATGRVHMFSNGDITTVANLSRNPLIDFIEINVDASADLNRVLSVINTAGERLLEEAKGQLHAPPAVQGLSAVTATAITVRVSVTASPLDLASEQMRVRAVIRDALVAADLPPA